MHFVQRNALQSRGPTNPEPPVPVEGTLLLAEALPFSWEDHHSQYGCDVCSLRPAVHNGEYCFVLLSVWHPAPGYCAEGAREVVISKEDGFDLLMKHGGLAHLWSE